MMLIWLCLITSVCEGFRLIKSPKNQMIPRNMNSVNIEWGSGQSQLDLMNCDECVAVDFDDKIIGSASKYLAHKFDSNNEKGVLHRAFSVFLFNSKNELLLQQRASSKITFPTVWTNTCCSHPLYGQNPNEVDNSRDIINGNVVGIISAAKRKLKHELGIDTKFLDNSMFKYLGRIHYCAADINNNIDSKATWGENEIDYILFLKCNVNIQPNKDEVQNVKYVNLSQLREMMDPSSGLKWSPWFKIIVDQLLVHWWDDMDTTMTSSKVDYNKIHRFL